MKTQIITLKITYDEDYYSPPEEWNWSGVLDMQDNNDVELLDYSEIKEV